MKSTFTKTHLQKISNSKSTTIKMILPVSYRRTSVNQKVVAVRTLEKRPVEGTTRMESMCCQITILFANASSTAVDMDVKEIHRYGTMVVHHAPAMPAVEKVEKVEPPAKGQEKAVEAEIPLKTSQVVADLVKKNQHIPLTHIPITITAAEKRLQIITGVESVRELEQETETETEIGIETENATENLAQKNINTRQAAVLLLFLKIIPFASVRNNFLYNHQNLLFKLYLIILL
mmetsp:Transcript_3791/g.5544  ORF Transcript_3791/g.5544 Transcript_3791/m.5544 type:complete len:233 (-) Transcript_3791:330-1028(-)